MIEAAATCRPKRGGYPYAAVAAEKELTLSALEENKAGRIAETFQAAWLGKAKDAPSPTIHYTFGDLLIRCRLLCLDQPKYPFGPMKCAALPAPFNWVARHRI